MNRYYLDTNALYAYYRDGMKRLLFLEPQLKGTAVIQALSNENLLFISSLTYTEFLGVLLRHERGGELRKAAIENILRRLRDDVVHRGTFQLVPVNDALFQEAQTLMLNYARKNGCSLDTNDALHLAIAKNIQPPVIIVTSDGGKKRGDNLSKMKCACERIGLQFFDPEQAAEI